MRPQHAAAVLLIVLVGASCRSDTGGSIDSPGSAPLRPGVTTTVPGVSVTTVAGAPASTKLNATLSGKSEVPGPGKADAMGTAALTLSSTGQICVSITVSNLDKPTSAHIHTGAAGVSGPILVTLPAPSAGSSTGCVNATPAQVSQIIANPAGYYVNVHNAGFPAGGARGQLVAG